MTSRAETFRDLMRLASSRALLKHRSLEGGESQA